MTHHSRYLKDVVEALRMKGGLDFLQLADPSIENVIMRATFVSVYVLNEIDQKWARADLEGPLYIVSRSVFPQLVIVNQRDPRNLVEDITPLWEVSSEKNYLFFRVPLKSTVQTHPVDPKDRRVAGLWFSDDIERQSVQHTLEHLLSSEVFSYCVKNLGPSEQLSSTTPTPPVTEGEKGNRSTFDSEKCLSKKIMEHSEHTNPKKGLKNFISEPEGKMAGKAILNLIGANRCMTDSQNMSSTGSLGDPGTYSLNTLNGKSTDHLNASEVQHNVSRNSQRQQDFVLNSRCSSIHSSQSPNTSSWIKSRETKHNSSLKQSNGTQDSNSQQRTLVHLHSTVQNEGLSPYCVTSKNQAKGNAVVKSHWTRPKSPTPYQRSLNLNFSKTPTFPLSQVFPQDSNSVCDVSSTRCLSCLFRSLEHLFNECRSSPCFCPHTSTTEGYNCGCGSCCCTTKPTENLCRIQCTHAGSLAVSNVHSTHEKVCSNQTTTTTNVRQECSSYGTSSESFLSAMDQKLLITLFSRLVRPTCCNSFSQHTNTNVQCCTPHSTCQCSSCQSCCCRMKFVNNC